MIITHWRTSTPLPCHPTPHTTHHHVTQLWAFVLFYCWFLWPFSIRLFVRLSVTTTTVGLLLSLLVMASFVSYIPHDCPAVEITTITMNTIVIPAAIPSCSLLLLFTMITLNKMNILPLLVLIQLLMLDKPPHHHSAAAASCHVQGFHIPAWYKTSLYGSSSSLWVSQYHAKVDPVTWVTHHQAATCWNTDPKGEHPLIWDM